MNDDDVKMLREEINILPGELIGARLAAGLALSLLLEGD